MAIIDVLMPAYNASETIEEAVESLRGQTFSDFRLIIVDDGSTDESPKIMDRLASLDSRIVIIRKENGGIVEARNTALSHSDSEFIACLDADDIALPHRLEKTLQFLREHPDCVAVGGAVEHIDESGQSLKGQIQPGPPEEARVDTLPAREPYILHSTVTARRAAINAVGGYRHVPNSEDSDLFWRLAEKGKLAILPQTVSKYRVHVSSISSSLQNGRVMAVGSQLGAKSAALRRSGRQDIEFSRRTHETLKQMQDLEEMVTFVSSGFEESYQQHYRMAVAVKLMELAGRRPFEPDARDCAFICSSWQFADQLDQENRKQFIWYLTVTAARLARLGRLGDARTLLPPQLAPMALARFIRGQS